MPRGSLEAGGMPAAPRVVQSAVLAATVLCTCSSWPWAGCYTTAAAAAVPVPEGLAAMASMGYHTMDPAAMPRVDTASLRADASYLGEHRHVDGEVLPASVDWVKKGAVTSVKSQRCGNCWTFSAAGSIEGAYQISGGKLTNFSEQEFVDCCDTGCKGGWNFNALKFAVNHTVCTLAGFPCTGKGNGTQCSTWKSSPCSKAPGALRKGGIAGWKSVGGAKWGHTTEADLMSALQIGPVSINMFADSHMGHYKGGVLTYSNCSEGTNHGVLAVGYGTCKARATPVASGPCANVTKKTDYWKVKNSWGTGFGDKGYFYLARGVYAAGCGTASILLTNPSYPVMAKDYF